MGAGDGLLKNSDKRKKVVFGSFHLLRCLRATRFYWSRFIRNVSLLARAKTRPAERRGPPSPQVATTRRGTLFYRVLGLGLQKSGAATIKKPPLRGQNSFNSVDSSSWDCITKAVAFFFFFTAFFLPQNDL